MQKLNTLNLRLFHSPSKPRNHFSTVFIETNWYTTSCKYSGCTGLTSVIIPNSVTSIGSGAFYGCTGLTSITIPESVTSIGSSVFNGCTALTSVIIPNSVTSIGSSAFNGCPNLVSVTLNANDIVSKTYTSSSNLKTIFGAQVQKYILGNDITSIGNYAFYNSSNLTSITIPESVTSIGTCAFKSCSGLTSITIPESVTSIGGSAFGSCPNLTSVTLNANDIVSKTYTYSSNFKTIFGTQVLEYILGNDITSIGPYAFYDSSNLTSITIPESVTSIGSWAFNGCSGLTSITIPESVTSIGERAFGGCTDLTSVSIPNSVTDIGSYAFNGCSGLTSVSIGNSLTGIGESTFRGCSCLTSVTIGNSVTSIGPYAFYNCSSLTSITIPNSVTSIGSHAFYGCSGLTSIKVNTGNPVYDSRYNCNAIIETKTNTLIQGCKNTIIPEDVTSIGEDAFVLCTGLTSINIPSSVTSISDEAFAGCTGLQAVYCDATNIPTTGKNVFRNIASATLYVPESMVSKYRYKTPWSDFSTISPFPYFNVDGIYYNIYTTGTNVSVTYNPTSPSGYLSIVEIPSTVKYNDKQYIVNRIGTSAFSGCSELTSVKVPESVISIGESAFEGCTRLTSITIPNSVTSIGSSAFKECPLQTIVNHGNKAIGDGAFSDRVYLHTQLYVPEGTVWDYIFNTGWGEFHHIKEFASKADDIRNDAVYMIADRSGRNFPVYDKATKSLKNVTYTLNLDDNDAGACWRIVKDGSDTYLYNIGAGMYASYDLDNNLALSIAPTAVNIEVTEDGATINGRPVMLVANKSLTPVGPEYILGDANGNGVVEIGDVTSVLTLMATPEATGYNNKAADANGNGEIEIGDVTTILTIMANGE